MVAATVVLKNPQSAAAKDGPVAGMISAAEKAAALALLVMTVKPWLRAGEITAALDL